MATEYFGRKGGLSDEVANDLYTPGDTIAWFGTVSKSMLSLLQIATMDSWCSQIGRPIILYEPVAAIFLIFFLVLVGFAFLNLLTATFVETLTQANTKESSGNVRLEERYHMVEEFAETYDISSKLYDNLNRCVVSYIRLG